MLNGCLLIHKEAGISSFGVIEQLQRLLRAQTGKSRKDLPKLGHGGTLDPFATGLLVVCVGEGTKLSRYFLGSFKEYSGVIRFGETTVPGDPTDPISERVDHLPADLSQIQKVALSFCEKASGAPYLQIPPMHSAKKRDGKRLYELAREGVEIAREPIACEIESFEISRYTPPTAHYRARVSSGTYIRVLGQDLGKRLGTVAMLNTLERTASGSFRLEQAMTLDQIVQHTSRMEDWTSLPCFIPLDLALQNSPTLTVSPDEALLIRQGNPKQIQRITSKLQTDFSPYPWVVLHDDRGRLTAIFSAEQGQFQLDRVFHR